MSFLETIRGVMSRRVLLNYRLDPDVLQRALPAPFRPKLYRGRGIGGAPARCPRRKRECQYCIRLLRDHPLRHVCGRRVPGGLPGPPPGPDHSQRFFARLCRVTKTLSAIWPRGAGPREGPGPGSGGNVYHFIWLGRSIPSILVQEYGWRHRPQTL